MTTLNKLFFLIITILLFTSCRKTRGCTDSEALNYNPDAAKEDHSCYYYWVGQNIEGGKVFYIDQTKKHGLVASENDLALTQWGNVGSLVSGADGTIVGTGYQNTIDIVNSFSVVTAASLCNDLDTLGHSDWYLPSIEEMKGLANAFGPLGQGNFGSGYYWTSTEADSSTAWLLMGTNNALVTLGKTAAYSVRAIRSF